MSHGRVHQGAVGTWYSVEFRVSNILVVRDKFLVYINHHRFFISELRMGIMGESVLSAEYSCSLLTGNRDRPRGFVLKRANKLPHAAQNAKTYDS